MHLIEDMRLNRGVIKATPNRKCYTCTRKCAPCSPIAIVPEAHMCLACINLFTTARIRNAEHFRRLCGIARPEVMHWAQKKRVITPDVLQWFRLFLVCKLSCTQQNYASAKFVAHSEELTTGLEWKSASSSQKLVPFLLTNSWTAIVDI